MFSSCLKAVFQSNSKIQNSQREKTEFFRSADSISKIRRYISVLFFILKVCNFLQPRFSIYETFLLGHFHTYATINLVKNCNSSILVYIILNDIFNSQFFFAILSSEAFFGGGGVLPVHKLCSSESQLKRNEWIFNNFICILVI